MMRLAAALPLLVLLFGSIDTPLRAQSSTPTSAEIDRLDQTLAEIGREIDRVRPRDAALASSFSQELEGLREEVVYLRVKARKDNVSRREFTDVSSRIDALHRRVRGEEVSRPAQVGTGAETSHRSANEIPVGQQMDVRLQTPLSSETAQVEDRFEATTVADLIEDRRVLIPAGSVVRGVVQSVTKAGRLERKGSLTLSFDQITVHGQSYPIRATVIDALESEGIKGEVGKIGTAAGVGAIIGGILGGYKGVLAGILIGAGGTVVATEGKDVELAAGTVLRVRFDEPLTLDSTRISDGRSLRD